VTASAAQRLLNRPREDDLDHDPSPLTVARAETFAGAMLHLTVLGVVMGVLLGALGGLVGKALRSARRPIPTVET
jgi:hypothetical protein